MRPTPALLYALLCGLILTLTACVGAQTAPDPLQPERGFVKGRVLDRSGRPLAGAEVFADNTVFPNSNVVGRSDAAGRYRLDLRGLVGSWSAGATLTVDYRGRRYTFGLHPLDNRPFTAEDAAVRDFEWRLQGPTPDPDYVYGAAVWFEVELGNREDVRYSEIEFTLEPQGPLVDGSAGTTLVLRGLPGGLLTDIPVGHYLVSARYLKAGQAAVRLTLRPRGGGEYQDRTALEFYQVGSTGQEAQLEVRFPD